jgi:hypothetical protein
VDLFNNFLKLGMAATAGVLGYGLFTMMSGNKEQSARGNCLSQNFSILDPLLNSICFGNIIFEHDRIILSNYFPQYFLLELTSFNL